MRLKNRVNKIEDALKSDVDSEKYQNRTLDDFYRESNDPESDTAKINQAFYDPDRGCKDPSEVLNK